MPQFSRNGTRDEIPKEVRDSKADGKGPGKAGLPDLRPGKQYHCSALRSGQELGCFDSVSRGETRMASSSQPERFFKLFLDILVEQYMTLLHHLVRICVQSRIEVFRSRIMVVEVLLYVKLF